MRVTMINEGKQWHCPKCNIKVPIDAVKLHLIDKHPVPPTEPGCYCGCHAATDSRLHGVPHECEHCAVPTPDQTTYFFSCPVCGRLEGEPAKRHLDFYASQPTSGQDLGQPPSETSTPAPLDDVSGGQ